MKPLESFENILKDTRPARGGASKAPQNLGLAAWWPDRDHHGAVAPVTPRCDSSEAEVRGMTWTSCHFTYPLILSHQLLSSSLQICCRGTGSDPVRPAPSPSSSFPSPLNSGICTCQMRLESSWRRRRELEMIQYLAEVQLHVAR